MKKVAQAIPVSPEPAIRILKIGTCPSLSESSTLTFHIGCTPELDIQFRVYSNSGSGYHSREYISGGNIQKILADNSGKITCFTLAPLYRGKSQNNSGFLLAVLKHLGLVQSSAETERCYETADHSRFIAEVKALIESDVSLDPDTKPPKKPMKKSA